jgi:hypothetical protein
MTEEQEESVTSVETEAPAEVETEIAVAQGEPNVEPAPEPPMSNQEYNWRAAERKRNDLERQLREEREYRLKLQEQLSPKAEEDDGLEKLGDDDIITKAHAKKLAQKIGRQIAEEVIKKRDDSTVEERVRNRCPDFDEFVTPENIENLKKQEPELALSLANTSDNYSKAVATYKVLKQMIGANVEKRSIPEKEKALKNSQKPLSVNAVSKNSAIGNAHLFENGLTDELKASLYKEMQQCAKYA